MVLNIRWDATDTTYISGPPNERYVHWPLEVSSTLPTAANVYVLLSDPSGNKIVEQTYEGLNLNSTWIKFSPALLVPDSYFVKSETWTLKALLYTNNVPVDIPKQISKTIQNTPATQPPTSRNMLLILAGGLLLLLAFGGKRFLK